MIVTGMLAAIVGLILCVIALTEGGSGSISRRASTALAVLGLAIAFGGAVLLDTTVSDRCTCVAEANP